ncbi:MAG: hypothetical protein JNL38_26845 [Myxococcales bacterium]|jgi:hypothetical protein|nr:hypothetical protein [Myxococcales bacterium]
MRPLLPLAVVALALLAAACAKKPGGKCSNEAEAECRGKTAALTCHDKTWMELSCRGPKGCVTTGNTVECDESLAQAGDACDHEGNVACAVDKKASVKCDKGKWVADEKCPKGCEVTGLLVKCE